jgi:hypothetical protein
VAALQLEIATVLRHGAINMNKTSVAALLVHESSLGIRQHVLGAVEMVLCFWRMILDGEAKT